MIIYIIFTQNIGTMISIRQATINDSKAIAGFIMEAMTDECCRYFYGPNHSSSDFMRLMTELVESVSSQYSYLNALVAVDEGQVVGAAVSYDGACLHQLRAAFVEGAKKYFGRDFSDIADETSSGELYLDSFAVNAVRRHQGIGTRLLNATIEKAAQMNIPCVGLLVDKNNPTAERMYLEAGFCYVGDSVWGGHSMRHLQKSV